MLPSHRFHDPQIPAIVEAIVSDVNIQLLPQNQQAQIAPFLVDNQLQFRRRQDTPTSTAAQIKIDVLNPTTGLWEANPVGIDNAIGVLFPETLYIEAMEDAAEDIGKSSAKNTIGLLLKYALDQLKQNNLAAMQSIQQALIGLDTQLNGATRAQQLGQLEQQATNAISDFFPGLEFFLDIQTPTLDELVKSASVSLSDMPGTRRPFSSFGHGAQRSVQMALINLLASQASQNGAAASTTVLLIDEPELYLHPQAVELLKDALVKLSNGRFQVVFSTHSPLLVGKREILNTTLLLKDSNGKTQARQKLATAAQTIATNPHQTSVVLSLENSTYLLFSEKILIVEGLTEKLILPELYEVVMGRSLAHDKICLVEASSSSSAHPLMQVISGIGFTPKSVVDLDYIFKVAPGLGLVNETDPKFMACKSWFVANSSPTSFYLESDGLPSKKDAHGNLSTISPAKAYEALASALPAETQFLARSLSQHGIWVWSQGAIEKLLGIPAKNDGARTAFISTLRAQHALNQTNIPQEVVDMVHWL